MIPKQKLEKLYKSGLSMNEIATQENLSYYVIKYWMKKYDIARRSGSEASFYAYWNRQQNLCPFRFRPVKPLTIEAVKSVYYDKRLSAVEAAEYLGRSDTTLYNFMKRHNLRRRTAAETNEIIFNKKEPSYSLKKVLTPDDEKLKMAGIMLYWAEGARSEVSGGRSKIVDFANSNPNMIKLFLNFLREVCGVNEKRLRAYLYCYANQNIEYLKRYWHELTKIPMDQFTRPYIRNDFLSSKKDKMKHGLLHVRYGDKKLLLQIEDWVKQYLQERG